MSWEPVLKLITEWIVFVALVLLLVPVVGNLWMAGVNLIKRRDERRMLRFLKDLSKIWRDTQMHIDRKTLIRECPRCNKHPVIRGEPLHNVYHWFALCTDCQLRTNHCLSGEDLVGVWNQMAEATEVLEKVE